MKKEYLKGLVIFIISLAFLIISSTSQNYSQSKNNQYIGIEKCAKICHKGEKKGSRLEIWQKSDHSKAFSVLATPEAKEVFKKNVGDGDPQKSEKCLPCHIAGYGLDKSNFASSYKIEDGVSCEVCHGPGSAYKSISIMKDKEKFLANGGILPDEKVCIKCHNEKSPTNKEFKFEEMVKKIAHSIPEK